MIKRPMLSPATIGGHDQLRLLACVLTIENFRFLCTKLLDRKSHVLGVTDDYTQATFLGRISRVCECLIDLYTDHPIKPQSGSAMNLVTFAEDVRHD